VLQLHEINQVLDSLTVAEGTLTSSVPKYKATLTKVR